MRIRWWTAPCLAAAAALTLAACGSSGSSGSGGAAASPAATTHAAAAGPGSAMSATGITTRKTSLGTVLTDAKGFTLYWFAIDTPTKSNCTGSCLSYWPPLAGKPSVASGASLPGKWGTIKGANGKTQATYDGHPLYLYKGDTAAGDVNGNGSSLSGGKWWAMSPSGATLTAKPAPSSSPSSGGGGYGY